MARIRLRYVSGDVDRHGNARWYFRRPGQPKIRLRGLPGSDEFMTTYRAALAGETQPKETKTRPMVLAGTFRWLCVQYFGSSPYKHKLAAGSQRVRRRILEGVCETAGDVMINNITSAEIRRGIDRRAEKPEAANAFTKAMSGLFKFAITYGYATSNPTVGVERLRSKNPDGWHSWTREEVRQFEEAHPLGSRARLALALLLYTGARRSDAVKIGRQHVRDGWLKFRATKNRVEIEIPILPELQAAIDATEEKGDLTFLVSEYGRPWSSGDSFGNKFRDWCRDAGLPHCSPHGLRKAGASMAAERGATERQLDAIFGWIDPKMAARYTRKANRKTLAEGGMQHMGAGRKGNEIVPLKTPVSKGGAISPKKASKNNAL